MKNRKHLFFHLLEKLKFILNGGQGGAGQEGGNGAASNNGSPCSIPSSGDMCVDPNCNPRPYRVKKNTALINFGSIPSMIIRRQWWIRCYWWFWGFGWFSKNN